MARIVLRLECFHDDIAARRRATRSLDRENRKRVNARHFEGDLRRTQLGDPATWVAEVTGMDDRGKIKRRFLESLTEKRNPHPMSWDENLQNVTERAFEFLDRISCADPSRIVIMDLLDEISDLKAEVERLRRTSGEG